MAQPQKRRPESARRANRIIQTRTLLLLGVFGVLTFVLLFTKLYHWQITEHDELQSVAVRQQTLRTTVEASRGTIYDRNGTILAMSASAEDIFLSPKEIVENDQDQNLIANGLAEILNLDAADILKKMEKTNSQYEILKKKADDELADKVREFINENELRGVFLRPTSKRSYPKGTLASQVIGFANDNGGSMGLEATYNDELTGENGMVVTARDRDGRSVLYQYDQYFDAENGCDLHTTLDTTIQYYLEKGVQELEARFGTGKGATGIVMDVNTGAVLAMASLPTYDLNAPGKVYNDFLTSGMTEEQIEENMKDLLNKQWRSKAINDTYEPGSTFKTLTLAMALEENVVDLNTGFYCGGNTTIEGQKIWCSKRVGHGQQNLTQAFANSCNPAFINIGLRVGNAKFYQYMQDFGLLEKTGIDTTGEASGFANSEIKYSTLALACYAFGQNFNVTPVALLAAQCACVNGGYLYTPYLVEEITDQDGNVVSRHDATPIRQVISAETSALVRDIMEYEVTTGTGKNGQVAGYRIGGKTGTADKVGGNVIVSFVCFAPADDPQVMMLLTLDEPNKWTGTYVSGGNMVAPVASSVMGEILPYLGIEPSYTAEELVGADKTVPNVVGLSKDAAAERLSANGFSFRTVGSGDTVTDQTPAGGAIVPNSAEIILYLGAEKSGEKCIVPNVVGDSAATANQKIVNAGLIMGVSGATNASSSTVRAISQSIAAGTEVEAGTVVRVQFSDSSVRD
ncbi:MAG: PASTA domain-containing protein [Oscillibacter sp.]|nr:PASTA domain-containing protein [Oscillibacter sp.]MDY4397041.1 penicillin-binding transpeptidase domain-containing protein [Oscillospiraceae bacterium]MDY4907745.1 penicillin-binding transpeptidase domain-containing protein [Oscillospiraceae bacterium]